MVLNYEKYRSKIERMYVDHADIYRYEKVKNPETMVDETKLVAKYEDIPCRISQRALATVNQTEAQNNIAYETKLFISPDLEINQGDLIKISRNGVERRYEAGEPFLYPTHQEVSLQRREWA